MTEKSWLWTTGAASGDGVSTYTQSDTSEFMKIVAACYGFEGIAPNYLNAFSATTATNTVTLSTGAALVDGKPYKNDAAVPKTLASPTTFNRIDRIVLRATWAVPSTVRITVVTGTEASSPTPPAFTNSTGGLYNTSGNIYDILLYQALITPAGAITLTDERTWASLIFMPRQGGSPGNWATGGTTNYLNVGRIQCGTVPIVVSSMTTITFPLPFNGVPVVTLTPNSTNPLTPNIYAISATYCQFATSGVGGGYMYWVAIGPA